MYSQPELQLFPKQLKNQTRVQAITQKEYCIEIITTFLYERKINFYSCYILNKFVPHLVVTSNINDSTAVRQAQSKR
jgi:hypothetical protein